MEKMSKYVMMLIEVHRKKKYLTQEEIANIMGISKRYYQNLIIYKYTPRFDTLYEMCEKLELPLKDLINDAENLKINKVYVA